jgi:hypothetical protein
MKDIEIEIKDLLDCYEGISILGALKINLKASLGFELAIIKGDMDPYAKAYNEERIKVLERIGSSNGNGTFDIPMDKMEEFNSVIEELTSKKVTVKGLGRKIKISEFGEADLPIKFCEVFKNFIEM